MTAAAIASPALQPRRGTYAGLFLVTLSTLMYEIALTRIFSVSMWYHFAFVAISVALFGMTVGALAVHLSPGRFREPDVRRHLWIFSALFAAAVVVCFLIQLNIPFTPASPRAGCSRWRPPAWSSRCRSCSAASSCAWP